MDGFQSTAFQNNAFQIETEVEIAFQSGAFQFDAFQTEYAPVDTQKDSWICTARRRGRR